VALLVSISQFIDASEGNEYDVDKEENAERQEIYIPL
jgi:hypothetical protein